MNALDYILDGLEAALELERELGVRVVECDRSLLTPASRLPSNVSRLSGEGLETRDVRRETRGGLETRDVRRETRVGLETRDARPAANNRTIEQSNGRTIPDLAFLHDRPLSPAGIEMMAKIIGAMKRTAENSPIVVEPPMPRAKVLVVLGGRALRKYFPEQKAEPGQWFRTPGGRDVLVTYSPEYILRFDTVTPAVQKLKQDMWRSLKAVVQRLKS